MTRYPARALAVLFLSLAAGIGACTATSTPGEPAAQPADGPPAADAGHVDQRSIPELRSIPEPDLTGLAPQARAEVEAGRATLDAAISDAAVPSQALGELFGAQGRLYHAYQLYAQAEPCYANAETLDPRNMAWPYYLGRVLREVSRPDDAAEAFERALAIDPDDVPALYWLADLHLQRDAADLAAPLLERAAAQAPASAAVWIALARVTAAREEHAKTVEYLLKAKALDPAAGEVDYPLGLAYRALGDTAKAESLMHGQARNKAVLDDPLINMIEGLATGATILVNRGVEAVGRGDYDEAERLFREAIALDPRDADAHLNLAVTLAGRGQAEAALEPMGRAIEIDSGNARANFNMGSLLARLQRDGEAVPYLEKAAAVDPNYKEAHLNLANALRRLGRTDEALPHFARVIELDPGHRDARQAEATLLFNARRWPEAKQALENAHAALPGDAAFTMLLARLLATCPDEALRDGPRALALIQPLADANPIVDNVRVLGMALAAAGRFPDAAAQATRALTAARQAGRQDLERALTADLAAYQAGQPVLVR